MHDRKTVMKSIVLPHFIRSTKISNTYFGIVNSKYKLSNASVTITYTTVAYVNFSTPNNISILLLGNNYLHLFQNFKYIYFQ